MKAALFLVLMAWTAPALAQSPLELAPSKAVACLQPPPEQRGKPAYPAQLQVAGVGGSVLVEIEFGTADGPPAVREVANTGPAALYEAAKAYVLNYRVPCLGPSEYPVRMQQEFVFDPEPIVNWTTPEDIGHLRRKPEMGCVRHLQPGTKPEYPPSAARRGESGVVLASMQFTSADGPPLVTLLDPGPSPLLARAVTDFVSGYRLPCHAGKDLLAIQYFEFRFDTTPEVRLPPTPLVEFLRSVRDIRKTSVSFDLNRMSCPFDVRLVYRRPNLPNEVGEAGSSVRARRPFLDWLATLRLDVPPKAENLMLGKELTVKVPCGRIDL